MYRQSGSTHIPLRVNTAGMIPLIFAMSIVIFPGMVASYFANPTGAEPNLANHIMNLFNPNAATASGLILLGTLFSADDWLCLLLYYGDFSAAGFARLPCNGREGLSPEFDPESIPRNILMR